MNLTDKALWQVGAGDTERNYGEICKHFDVMLIGPGAPGVFNEAAYAHLGGIRHSLRRFYMEARSGDIVLLRIGTGSILCVGIVADDEAGWLDAFGDVDGWDLNHVRRVRWLPNVTKEFAPTTLGGQVSTFAKVKVPSVKEWIEGLPEPDTAAASRKLADLPASGIRLTPQTLGTRLFNEGLPSEYIEKLMTTLASIERVASWYKNKTKRPEGRPSEHETVCYLVMPLLFSLGWSQQTAAIEWNHVDVALFNGQGSRTMNG